MCKGSEAAGRQTVQAAYQMAKVFYILPAAERKVNEQIRKAQGFLTSPTRRLFLDTPARTGNAGAGGCHGRNGFSSVFLRIGSVNSVLSVSKT